MTNQTQSTPQLSTSQALLGIVLAFVILVLSQMGAFMLGEIPANFGVPDSVCNLIMGVLYAGLAYCGAALLSAKFLKIPRIQLRIPKPKVKLVWIATAVLMPLVVVLLSLLVKGHWEENTFPTSTTLAMVTATIAFYGLATGIVEEIVFRGLIMSCIEYRWNREAAILIPSILFGLPHTIGNSLDVISTLQLLAAGTVVGILFSLIAYESESVWNNALVHGVWNMVMIGSIFHIGNQADSQSILNYVMDSKSFLLTGGDFGIEASVQSIVGYLVFIGLAVVLLRKKALPQANG